MGWTEHFSLVHQRMEWAGLDSEGLGSEGTSNKMCSQWRLLLDVKQLKAHLAKKEGMNECFPFLSGNYGKMTESGVPWVLFPPSSLFCILLLLLPLFPEKKDTKLKGDIYSLCKVSK